MSITELQWLVGVAMTALGIFGGMLFTAFRALSTKIDRGNDALSASMKDGDDKLHERVNRVRDEYVRRVDLDGHLGRIELTQREMRDELRHINRALLNALPRPAPEGDRN